MMRILAACALWWLATALPTLAVAAEADMLQIDYKIVAFGIDPRSFAALPRRLWRSGTTLVRLEEPLDPATLEHRLVISALPDIWTIDLGTLHGVHGRDTSAASVVHFPVFTVDPGDPLAALEMGGEADFFAANSARDVADKAVAGVDCSVREMDLGGRKLALYRRKDNGVPMLVSIESGDRVLGVRYLAYRSGLPLDPTLFIPPPDVVFDEKN